MSDRNKVVKPGCPDCDDGCDLIELCCRCKELASGVRPQPTVVQIIIEVVREACRPIAVHHRSETVRSRGSVVLPEPPRVDIDPWHDAIRIATCKRSDVLVVIVIRITSCVADSAADARAHNDSTVDRVAVHRPQQCLRTATKFGTSYRLVVRPRLPGVSVTVKDQGFTPSTCRAQG